MFPRYAAALALVALLSASAQAKLIAPSKHRKITNGVGNCIFSANPLPFNKESSFKDLRTTFDESAKRVYARCYLPKQLKEYETQGKEGSSLRTGTPPEYYALYWGHRDFKRQRFKYGSKNKEYDQMYFYLGGSKQCDLCGDLAAMAKEPVKPYQIKEGKKSHTQKFCVKVYFLYAESKKWVVVRGRREHHFVNKEQPVAQGCFEYTVKL